ncbi:MAG: prenyltransferase/squalene oxidase repeat-containing protein [Anaerolineae bacterium]
MDLQRSIHHLLKEVAPGQSQMTNTAYDTAWVARLAELDEPMGEQALDWLRSHQLADGSWGASEPQYYYDRFICTLAAMAALARRGQIQDRAWLRRAHLALETAIKGLSADPASETIGFEMIAPTLLTEAEALGIIQRQCDSSVLGGLARKRAAKLSALPGGTISRFVTVAFSAEMAGPDGLHLLDVENLQETNGSVGHSPSATAYFALYGRRQDSMALGYLRKVVDDSGDGGVPVIAPSDVFEIAWTLRNLALVGPLGDETLALCQPHLDFLEATWEPGRGIPQAAGYTPKDGDDTGLVYEVLTRFGRAADVEAVLHYEEDEYFRCFALEANPSVGTNIHVLGALRQAGFGIQHPPVQKILRFLRRAQILHLSWFDKWHASPYYPTAHAVITCAGYDDELVNDAVCWILGTQNGNGSWGYYMPTAEETAYCLQALIAWKRHGGQVPGDVLKRGAAWLADHTEPPYPPLWIGKCLYCPELVVRSAIMSALMLITQEG